MGIPFELKFLSHNTETHCVNFTESWIEAITDSNRFVYQVEELKDLRVLFKTTEAAKNLRLFIEFMDVLPTSCFNVGEENFYYPSNEERYLYLNEKSNLNVHNEVFSELLPGKYKVGVDSEVKIYFCILEVIPSRLDSNQLNLMREEIEETLLGLSQQFTKKNHELIEFDRSLEIDIFNKYQAFMQRSEKVVNELWRLQKNPNYNLKKTYKVSFSGMNRKVDLESIKYSQTKAFSKNQLKSYQVELTYDLETNRALKTILFKLIKQLRIVIRFINRDNSILQKEINEAIFYNRSTSIRMMEEKLTQQKENFTNLNKMMQLMIAIYNSVWLSGLSEMKSLNVISLSRSTKYYNTFQLFKEINSNKSVNENPMENYIYYWKETSKLYEIWGFLKIIRILNAEFSFDNISGWVFDDDTYPLPFLDSNTQIKMSRKDGLEIVVYYDGSIVKSSSETNLNNPIYTFERNNRPDVRMDIYMNGYYKGTLIADLKYRALNKLGTLESYRSHNERHYGYKVYKQLVNYTRILSFYLNAAERNSGPDSSVKRVYAFYPVKESIGERLIRDVDSNIVRASLSPGNPSERVSYEISELINSICNLN